MSVVRGGLWSATSRLLPAMYTLMLSVVAARILGPELMGRQSFIAFVAATAVTLCTAGLPVAVMRHAGESAGAQRWNAVRALLRWALRVEAVAALVGTGALVAVGTTRDSLGAAWVLAGLACGLLVLQTVPSAILIGLQRWREASVVGVVTGFVGAVATVVVLGLGGGVVGMFAVELAVAAANLSWAVRFARRALVALPESDEPAGDVTGRTARYARLATVQAILALVVWRRSEFFFLARYAGDSDIALYSIAFAATTALSLVPQGIAAVLGPAVATMHGAGDEERIASAFSRGVRLLALLSLPITAGVLAVGPLMLRLVYGDEYRAAGTVLLWLMVAFPLLPLYHLGTGLLTGVGAQREIVVSNSLAAFANIALDITLIPHHGAVGAAAANAAAQAIGSVLVGGYAIRRMRRVDWRPATVVRVVVASALTYVVARTLVRIDGWAGLALAVVGGAVTFAVAAFALRVAAADDVAWVRERLGR